MQLMRQRLHQEEAISLAYLTEGTVIGHPLKSMQFTVDGTDACVTVTQGGNSSVPTFCFLWKVTRNCCNKCIGNYNKHSTHLKELLEIYCGNSKRNWISTEVSRISQTSSCITIIKTDHLWRRSTPKCFCGNHFKQPLKLRMNRVCKCRWIMKTILQNAIAWSIVNFEIGDIPELTSLTNQ